VPNEFWSKLQNQLFSRLLDHSCFFPLSFDENTLARFLRLVPDTWRDDRNQPLLSNCSCTKHVQSRYVSNNYDATLDIPILQKLGLKLLSEAEFVELLRCDLKSTIDSRLRTTPVWSQWHTHFSKCLLQVMATSTELANDVKKLALVPLVKDERWVPSYKASIFFPQYDGMDIPRDLPLSLVDPRALINKQRKKLLQKLGVEECDPKNIFPMMEQACKKSDWGLDEALDHIKFVFWNHSKLPAEGRAFSCVVISEDLVKADPTSSIRWWYNPISTESCSAANVIGCPVPEQLQGKLRFLHPRYYGVLGACGRRHDKTGAEWLEEFLEIRSIPEPRKRKSKGISEEFEYLATRTTDSIALEVLRQQWPHVALDIQWQEEFRALARVPILDSDSLSALSSTYLPLPRLKDLVCRLELQRDFGFIEELDGMKDDDVSTWSFLRHVGVKFEEDLSFWLLLLKKARQKNSPGYEVMSEIYSRLQGFSSTPRNKTIIRYLIKFDYRNRINTYRSIFGSSESNLFSSKSSDRIKELFEDSQSSEKKYIYILTKEDSWIQLVSCRWDTPAWYRFHHSLARKSKYEPLKTFFVDYLSVPAKPAPQDYLNYISHLKKPIYEKRRGEIIKLLYDELYSEIRKGNVSEEYIK
jgi:hypothetical protein